MDVRYDDMIGTVLRQPPTSPAAQAIAWVQIVDLLAQGRGGADTGRGLAFLRAVRTGVPTATRMLAARSLAGRRLPAILVLFFAEDRAAIAECVLATARLDGDQWAQLMPMLSPTARGVLRNRRDLDGAAIRALAAYGPIDLVLGAPEAIAEAASAEIASVAAAPTDATPVTMPLPAPEPVAVVAPVATSVPAPVPAADGGVSISDLVKRIDAYRQNNPWPAAAVDPVAQARAFRFETDAGGIIRWVEGAPREAIIGETLAEAATGAALGVDGHVAGAFRRRSPFRDARLAVGGGGAAAGDWRISAVPFFAPGDGRFLGYRGSARRPRPDEVARPAGREAGLLGGGIAPDSLRQLVHELRTPLNAIMGFSEMIERQLLGPVDSVYRDQAHAIAQDGKRLLAAVDDLDMAARLDGGRLADTGSQIARGADAAALVAEIQARHPARAADDPRFDVSVTGDLPAIAGDPVVLERMVARLLAAAIGLATPGERLTVSLAPDPAGGGVLLALARPVRLADRDERTLMDPGYAPDGDWPDAPLLGLGFSLRLVRNLAGAVGGTLAIEEGRFVLRLPAGRGDADAAGNA